MNAFPAGWIVPDWPAPPHVRAVVTTRAGGASHGPYASFNLGTHVGDDPSAVARNREFLRSHLPADPHWLRQQHGVKVAELESACAFAQADGAVAGTRHLVCAVLTADCLPVLLAARNGAVVGIAHAGWRGLAAGVIEAVIARMNARASEIIAWLGPGIGPRAFEVGPDVYREFVSRAPEAAAAFAPSTEGKFLADLETLARQRLAAAGVGQVFGGGFCTFSDAGRFYSYRRERTTGRIASLIWID
jgi:YfiH family protein